MVRMRSSRFRPVGRPPASDEANMKQEEPQRNNLDQTPIGLGEPARTVFMTKGSAVWEDPSANRVVSGDLDCLCCSRIGNALESVCL